MKSLSILAIIVLSAVLANAQVLTTNIDIRATVIVLTNGVQSTSANSTQSMLYSGAKDSTRIDGLSWAYFKARAGGYTNNFENWIAKVWAKDNSDVTASAKLQAENELALRQLQDLLTVNFDLLSASDKTSLNTIRAKSPVTQ